MTANKSPVKEWRDMTTLERAQECERIADTYSPGWSKDRVLEQAALLRKKAENEKK